MSIGISTASFYPMETEQALQLLGEAGVRCTEVFFNSPQELEPPFVDKLCSIRDAYKMRITAVHPFSSIFEPFLFFSNYVRRFQDGRAWYRKYYAAAKRLGAKYLSLHGGKAHFGIDPETYCERLRLLIGDGLEDGVLLTQENVNGYLSASPDFLSFLKDRLGEYVSFTFDVKQAVRSGYTPAEVRSAMGGQIVQVHMSDHTTSKDCLLPGSGSFDFKAFFDEMKQIGYRGDYMIEVYRNAYDSVDALMASYHHLCRIFENN